MLSFSPPQIWLYEKLRLIHPPLVPFDRYQLKHYHDRKPKDKEMDPTKLTKLLKLLTSIDNQWEIEWWRIEAMISYGFKENCVPLVGLCCYCYYPTCRIARQFGDRQRVPCDNCSYHILAFTESVLGRIKENWSLRAMNRDIYFPQFLNPTLGYKNWLSIDMRSIHGEENDHKKSNKRKRTE